MTKKYSTKEAAAIISEKLGLSFNVRTMQDHIFHKKIPAEMINRAYAIEGTDLMIYISELKNQGYPCRGRRKSNVKLS